MPTVSRSFDLRIVKYLAGRRRGFQPPRLDDLIDQLWTNATTIGERHWPPVADLEEGMSCLYVNSVKRRRRSPNISDGRIVEVVSYIYGNRPEQITPNFREVSSTIDTPALTDANGNRREIVHSYRIGVIGHSLVVESVKGAGGSAGLAVALTQLFRQWAEPELPTIQLVDVMSQNLRRQIDAGGGVDRIVARLIHESADQSKVGSYLMSQLKENVRGAGVLVASIESVNGPLNADDAIRFWEECQDDNALDSVTLHLKDGQKVDRIGRFRERRRFDIQVTRASRVAVNEIEEAIWNYLDELRNPDESGWRIIDDDGRPVHGVEVLGDGHG